MSAELHTWMKHSETGGEWECPTVLIEHYERLGWVVMDSPPEEQLPAVGEFASAADAPAPATKDPAVEFDPAEHTVAEVKEHLAEHPEDAEQVVEAEQASDTPRKSIVGD
jgi:hypothetical protein